MFSGIRISTSLQKTRLAIMKGAVNPCPVPTSPCARATSATLAPARDYQRLEKPRMLASSASHPESVSRVTSGRGAHPWRSRSRSISEERRPARLLCSPEAGGTGAFARLPLRHENCNRLQKWVCQPRGQEINSLAAHGRAYQEPFPAPCRVSCCFSTRLRK